MFFARQREKQNAAIAAQVYRGGGSVINTLQLRRPTFIVEHPDGSKEIEYWSESMAPQKNAHSETLHHWEQFICEEADLVEDRIKHEAKKSGVPFEMLMDALTIELIGRFIGRVRERDAKLLKTQPIV